MRLETVLLSPHIAAEPSKTRSAGATVLPAKLDGATAPIYLLYTACRSLNGHIATALADLGWRSFLYSRITNFEKANGGVRIFPAGLETSRMPNRSRNQLVLRPPHAPQYDDMR